MTDNKKLAELLFPNMKHTPEDYEKIYPARNLPEEAYVTRFAPSPTGTLHMGNLIGSLLDEILAHQSKGVVYLRIEDTDKKREIEGGVDNIIDVLRYFEIVFDEGATGVDSEKGSYGPYKQSQRGEIYRTFAKLLIERGYAYPCFCTEEDIDCIRKEQEENKLTPGYYGRFAKHRDFTLEQIQEELAKGTPYVIRLKSRGSLDRRIVLHDTIKGDIEFPENDQDSVTLKSDGIPTYHFAHAVDDHFMRTTHVVRGDEWLSSVPLHFELFKALEWEMPKYAHISPVMKMEGTSKRKLSKRKDPEAALTFYKQEGYPSQSVREYLINLINSNFEEWRRDNPDKPASEFIVETGRMSVSGSVFDMMKFVDTSKEVISRMTAEQVYDMAYTWAVEFDTEFAELLKKHEAYTKNILGIERGGEKPRKDIGKWSDVKPYASFFYDELLAEETVNGYDFAENISKEEAQRILTGYMEIYNTDDEHEVWFDKIKAYCDSLGYAGNMKDYKKNKEAYKGHVGDVMGTIRVALTNRKATPDMHQIMRVLGYDRVMARLKKAAE